MIIGTGTDIVEISRLAEALEKIAARVFTAAELSRAESSAHRLEHLAGRWAAKEAFAKALGCGFGEKCSWLDIEITNEPNGKPTLNLSGVTSKTLEAVGGKRVHLSISHEKSYATAFVIIEE